MPCAQCGTPLLEGRRYCHACGAQARAGCPSCGSAIEPEWQFCPDCGTAQERAGDAPAQRVPPDLAERIRNEGIARGERKQVTVFFCDLVGSTSLAESLDPEVYREVLDQYLEIAFAEVHRMEGIVNQLAGDGFMALFGAPLAHEDDPVRAVRAALAAQDALARLGERMRRARGFTLSARIGIHTGMVVVGTVGNDLKMDYTAIGDTTNLAARLQSLAEPGTILVSQTTERLVRGWVRTEPVGPLEVRGRADPVQAHRILRLASRRSHMAVTRERGLTPFVGRADELAQLEACFRRAQGGVGQAVTVIGDAGAGKSRLVWEFKRRIEEHEVTIFEARCSALLQRIPYGPWARMLERFVGASPGDSAEEKTRRLAEVLGEEGMPTLPYLRRVLGLSAPELEDAREDSAKQQAFEAFEQLVLRAARRGPVVMIVEELHWIDEASLAMLRMAAARIHLGGVLLLVTHRPDYESPLRTRAAETRLRLFPLGASEGREILRAAAGGAPPAELERRILEKAEGNPFYIEELTRMLIDDGTLESDGAGATRTTRAVSEIAIPDTVQELLAARLDRLRPAAKRVAQIASVLGREFRSDHLARIFEQEWIDPDAELGELEALGVVHRKGGVSDQVYRFGESLTQEVAYESLLLSERRALHARIAELLEKTGEGLDVALVAHHWARSDQRERGVTRLLEAARQAVELPAYRNALRLFQEAWDLADELLATSDRPDAALQRAAIEAAQGMAMVAVINGADDLSGIHRAAETAAGLAGEIGDEALIVELQTSRGLLSMGAERFAEGIAMLEDALHRAEGSGMERLLLGMGRPLALAYALDGRLADARELIERILGRLEELGEKEALSDLYLAGCFFHARILMSADALEEGEALARWAYERAEQEGNRTVQGGTAGVIAHVLLMRGIDDEARRWARIAREVGEQTGSYPAEIAGCAIGLALRGGRGLGASPRDLETFESAVRAGDNLASNLDLVVEALIDAGEVGAALHYAEIDASRAGGRMREAQTAIVLAEALLAQPSPDVARASALLERGLGWARDHGSRTTRARALLGLARAARLRGEPSDALAGEALELFGQLGLARYTERARELAGRSGAAQP